MPDARDYHHDRAALLLRRVARLERALAAWAWVRALAAISLFVVLGLVEELGAPRGWALVPGALLIVSYAERLRLHPRLGRAARTERYHRRALARLDGTWVGLGPTGEAFADADHPYAFDLDVLGRGSLFDHLCTARTRVGERTLARWLLAPAAAAEIAVRQRAVDELRPRLALREHLAAEGDDAGSLDPDALVGWAEAPRLMAAPLWLWVSRAIAAGTVAAGVGAAALGWPPWPALGGVLLSAALTALLRRPLSTVFAGVVDAHRELAHVARVADRLAREPLLSSLGASLRQRLAAPPAAPAIGRLGSLTSRTALLRNDLVAPFAHALGLPVQLGAAMERWRARHGPSVRGWLDAVGQLEALLAFSEHAFENPDHVFPELVGAPRCFEAEALGHPLLPAGRCVRNDLSIGGRSPALVLLSGSNMSGKSTLLRAVGVAAVLALAGAPVRARRLRMSALSLGASIRVGDSVLDGTSRFMFEITRLRRIVAIAEAGAPAFFLLDEVLGGTNSEDRREGARGLLAGLVDRGAIGICTTHDLALTEIVAGLEERARNAHFSEHLRDGTLVFDYTLRDGPVRQSNALALMRAIGLRV